MIKRQLKTSNKIFSFLILGIFLISFVSASQQQNFGVVKQNSEIDLAQICADCTYNNVTSIVFPNKTILILDASMTKRGSVFNYTFNQTSSLGEHFVNGIGDPQGINTIWAYPFEVTSTGEILGISQGIILLAQLGVMALFFGLGRTFSEEKWKVRMFFDVISIIMAVVVLNSVKIIISQSASLGKMGDMGLIVGIIVLIVMILYMFIYALIEVFHYFKNKKEMRWKISEQ